MAEDPIKLFSTRAERYPQPTDADLVHGTARAALAAIPILGGSMTEVMSMVLAPAIERRREAWFKDLADGLDELEKKVNGFKVQDLPNDEAFVSAVIDATRIAISTHQVEKRTMLRNALLRVAVGRGPDEELQQVFLNAIQSFSLSHIKVLEVLWRGTQELTAKGLWDATLNRYSVGDFGTAIKLLHPQLAAQPGLLEYIMTDVKNWGFSRLSGPSDVFPQSPGITNVGIAFLQFVLAPEDLPK